MGVGLEGAMLGAGREVKVGEFVGNWENEEFSGNSCRETGMGRAGMLGNCNDGCGRGGCVGAGVGGRANEGVDM